MANTKSSKKDLRRIVKRTAKNRQAKTALKTYVKKVRTAAAAGDATVTAAALTNAVKMLDKAAQRGIIHKNAAARRKSRIAKAAVKIAATPVAVAAPAKVKAAAAVTGAKGTPSKAKVAAKATTAKAATKSKKA
jgi:small subunit ribosomal protein S20